MKSAGNGRSKTAELNGRAAARPVRPFWPMTAVYWNFSQKRRPIWPDPAGRPKRTGRSGLANLANEKERALCQQSVTALYRPDGMPTTDMRPQCRPEPYG